MFFDKLINHGLKFRAALAKGPGNITAGSHGNVLMHLNVIENLLPKQRLVAVHDDHGNQTGIDHLQQILVFEYFIGCD